VTTKAQLAKAVATLVAADKLDYCAMVRTVKMLHMLPVQCSVNEYPELDALLRLDDDRLAQILQLVAVRRDKLHSTPSQLWRREYMRNYMRQRRRANPARV
jgi:hypothetical protein